MIYSKKVIVVIPAGRRRYMEVGLPYILREYDVIDEIRYWVNTDEEADIEWMVEKSKQYDKIKLDFEFRYNPDIKSNRNIGKFFKKCVEKDTVYLRIDDDIVWMDCNYVEKMVNFRLKHPNYFLTYGNILNNAIVDYIHQRTNCFSDEFNKNIRIEYNCLDPQGWSNPSVAEKKHMQFLYDIENNNIDKYKFTKWILSDCERVSINSICWIGEEFSKFNGEVGVDEEQWLSVDKPSELKCYNIINGDAVCVHYAFYPQRSYLDTTNILEEYKKISLSL